MKHTIITVVYNGELELQKTIDSVHSQTYKNIEYIIIDGNSTDSTLDIIKNNTKKITFWQSKADKGIYDAMNKGIDLATGEYILFMNCGDIFASDDALEYLTHEIDNSQAELIAGGHIVDYGDGIKKHYANVKEELQTPPLKMPFCHQSLLAKRTSLLKFNFNKSYKIAADFNFLYDCLYDHQKVIFSDKIISVVTAGGVSDIKRKTTWLEYKRVLNSHGRNSLLITAYYNVKLVIESIKSIIKSLIWAK